MFLKIHHNPELQCTDVTLLPALMVNVITYDCVSAVYKCP